jgi:hypothetical protein
MIKWICNGCHHACVLVTETSSVNPVSCTLGSGMNDWKVDKNLHDTTRCVSFVCDRCNSNPCYCVVLDLKDTGMRTECPFDLREDTKWRLLR